MRGGRHLPARQCGLALLGLIAMISTMVLGVYVAGLNRSAASMAQDRSQRTSIALAQAKEALIAYAVTYKDTHDSPPSYTVPGYLPCPDLGPGGATEGQAASTCGASLVSVMGRLPWYTLGLNALKDGADECLWYAVSGTYKNNPNGVGTTTANMMNWDTKGLFKVKDGNNNTLAGTTEDDQAVAVILAPGAPLSGQNRTPSAGTAKCGGNYNVDAYLDVASVGGTNIDNTYVSPTASQVSTYVAGASSATFNDKIVYITRADIWNAIKKRTDLNNYLRALTRRAAQCVAYYATRNGGGANDKRLPWAADEASYITTLDRYAVNRRYRDASGFDAGRLPDRIDTSRNTAPTNLLTTYTEFGYTGYLLFTEKIDYCAYTKEEKIWYDNWKDHLYYGLAAAHRPTSGSSTAACTGSNCLSITNGTNTYSGYAAVVIFAGEKLSGRYRNTLAEKRQMSNYLESTNTSANSSGNNVYRGGSAGTTFNDFVYAIRGSTLAVSCYDAASGTMIAAPSAACP